MMRTMRLSELCAPLHGRLLGADREFDSVSTDTRTLRPGQLFVALSGPNFDGNRFVDEAAGKQACAAIVSAAADDAIPQLQVADTQQALGQLGRLNREQFTGPVFAVTGSSGKTTVKDMLAAILAVHFNGAVLATEGNLNNEIGVPLTLLRLSPEHRAAVLELGASAVGEIARTVALTQPQVAVITNAAGAHLEGFGGIEGVRRAKGEIYGGLGADGTAIVNVDDPASPQWLAALGSLRRLTFSLERDDADIGVLDLQPIEPIGSRFRLRTPEGEAAVQLTVAGRHNVANALAAAAAALAAGIPLAEIAEGLAAFRGVPGRLEFHAGPSGSLLIDDTYNANPASFRAAIDVLAMRPGRRILVMGDMAELGEDADDAHRAVGAYAREQGIEHLLAVGVLSEAAVAAFGSGALACDSFEALQARLGNELRDDVTVLVKGSRSSRMDTVVAELLGGTR